MNRSVGIGVGAALLLAALVAYSSLFTVNMTQQAIVLQFGEPIGGVVTEPGLHWKLPFVQNVVYIDRRLLALESPAEEIIASDRRRVVVDAFARYRIVDALRFYQAVRDPSRTDDRLMPSFESALRNTLGDNTLEELVRDNRAGLMRKIQETFNRATTELGIEVVDVRIRRADLPDANSQAIFRRMQTEREREAKEFRAQGEEESQRIRSRADRERTVLLAEAQKQAEIIRGEGDAEAVKIFAQSFGKDEEFFAFYRSLKAYRNALGKQDTTVILSPESPFLKYLQQGGR